jgi:alpha-N-arabinofuranosidase
MPDGLVTIDLERELGRIAPAIYGQFQEQIAPAIYGPLFDADAARQGETGLRESVLEALRPLHLPVIRWPGGNFASSYHWQDGVGPRDERPVRFEWNWSRRAQTGGGPLEECNQFGTNEFLQLCRALGAEAYLNLNDATAPPDESLHWLEYCNYDGQTHFVDLRRTHGFLEPHRVKYWGIGNEPWGAWQFGHTSPEGYARRACELARFLRVVDPDIKLLAAGHWDPAWNEPVLELCGGLVDYVTIHLYGRSLRLLGPSVQASPLEVLAGALQSARPADARAAREPEPGADDYQTVLATSVHFEQQLRALAKQIDATAERLGWPRKPAIALDEWNVRHVAEREGERYVDWDSPRSLGDALFHARVYHALHRLCSDVKMANYTMMVQNSGLVLVRGSRILKTAIWHVHDLLRHDLGPRVVASESRGEVFHAQVEADTGLRGLVEADYLDASATLSEDGDALAVSLAWGHPSQPCDCRFQVRGATLGDRVRGRLLTGPGPLAANTFEEPNCLQVEAVEGAFRGSWRLPPVSLTILRFALS